MTDFFDLSDPNFPAQTVGTNADEAAGTAILRRAPDGRILAFTCNTPPLWSARFAEFSITLAPDPNAFFSQHIDLQIPARAPDGEVWRWLQYRDRWRKFFHGRMTLPYLAGLSGYTHDQIKRASAAWEPEE